MKKPERRLFVSVACAAAFMVCGAVMMHLDKKPDEATFFAMDCPCTAAVYGGDAEGGGGRGPSPLKNSKKFS